MGGSDKKVEAIAAASVNHDGADIAATLSSLSLSGNKMSNVETEAQNHVYQNFGDQTDVLFNVPKEHMQFSQQNLAQSTDEDSFNAPEYAVFPNGGSNFSNLHVSKLASHSNSKFSMQSPHGNANKKGSLMSSAGSISHYQNLNGDNPGIDISGRHMKTHAGGFTSSMLNNRLTPGTLNPFPYLFLYACLSVFHSLTFWTVFSCLDADYGNILSNHGGSSFQGQPTETMYAQYLQANPDSPLGATASMSPFQGRGFTSTGHLDSPGYQKAYLGSLFAQQKLQYGMPYLTKSGALNPNVYGNDPAFGMGMTYLTSPPSSPYISSHQGHARQGERLTRIPSVVRNTAGGSMGSWNSENGLIDNGYGSSLLEEFKTNKTKSFELLDIVGHVVEFR